jgi:uncharacterized membrane protein
MLVQSICWTIPPFQSADEFNHVKRAWLLSKGEVFLHAKKGWTGGNIDTGLLDYIAYFYPIHDHKGRVTNPAYAQTRQIAWSGRREFSVLPNTAGYLPLPYAPQALAFVIGEHAGMSVRTSYYLARAASLIATLAILWLALRLYPQPPFVIFMLVWPMTLYQFSSASLDAISIAICVLTASLFMRGANEDESFTTPMHVALVFCVLALATSRSYLIVLTMLPLVLYSIRKSRSFLLSTLALITLSVGWLVYVFAAVKGMTGGEGVARAATIHYLKHPIEMSEVLINTFTSPAILNMYWMQFVGLFGAVDAPMAPFVYVVFAILTLVLALNCVERDRQSLLSTASLSMMGVALISTGMLILIILVVATPVGYKSLVGMYGRYFIPIAVFLGFSLFGRRLPPASRKVSLVLIFLAATTSVTSIAPAMISRYWLNKSIESSGQPASSVAINAVAHSALASHADVAEALR